MGEYVYQVPTIWPGSNEAESEVERKFVDSYERVDAAKADLADFSAGLESYIERIQLELGDDYQDNFNVEIPNSFEIQGTFPDFSYDSWAPTESPTFPTMGETDPLEPLVLDEYPRNTIKDPGFDLPSKPVPADIQEPGNPPEISEIELPVTPEFNLPDEISITEIEVPDAPTVEAPVFSAVAPDDDLDRITTPDFDYVEQVYSSDVWAPLVSKITDGVTNGGTGLSSEVEQLLFDSGRYRQDVEGERRLEEVRNAFANKGFDLPTGAKIANERNVLADIARDKTELNSKITIAQAELAQNNTQFMLDKGIALEQITVGFFDAQANRALDAVKASAEIVARAAQIRVDRYNSRAQVYNIRAQAYEQELRAAFADLEAFRITVDGKKVASDVQKNVVDVYVAQVGALESRARLYTAQVDGAKAAAEVERLKMENYDVEIKAFATRHDAKKIEYEAYGIEVDAEKTKVQAYSEKVKAFIAELEAVKASNQGKIDEQRAKIDYNSSLADTFKAEIIGYDSRIKELAAQHDVAIREFDANTNRYLAQAQVVESKNKLLMQGVEADLQAEQLKLNSETAKIDAIKNGYIALMDLEGKSRLGVFNATAQLMSSAMSSVSASASIGDSLSRGYSSTQSVGNSLTEQHSYNVSS